jgi:hypothetical protein
LFQKIIFPVIGFQVYIVRYITIYLKVETNAPIERERGLALAKLVGLNGFLN